MKPARTPSRLLLSIFFCIHFGAIGVYVLPFGPGLYDGLPDRVAALAERATVSLKYRGLLPALGYLNLFSLQQHWTLFGPEPVRWANSVRIDAWFPDDSGTWTQRRFRLRGPRESAGLKLGQHREWRILSNLGLAGWGDFYRPLMAPVLCRRLEDITGQRPDGVRLEAEWEEVRIPWRAPPEAPRYDQHLGGFDCPGSTGSGPPLPDVP